MGRPSKMMAYCFLLMLTFSHYETFEIEYINIPFQIEAETYSKAALICEQYVHREKHKITNDKLVFINGTCRDISEQTFIELSEIPIEK